MLNTADILETINMIREENLDIRTITMGISLYDCVSDDAGRLCDRIYDKITRKAEKLVAVGEEIEKMYGIPIVNKRVSVTPLAIAGGAYDEGYVQARQSGAQALLTGEVKHHNALAAAMEGFVLFDGTHWGTEQILVPHLAASLQKALSELKYSVNVYPSSAALFGSCID